jgi:DNA-binding PadR family transcriptional regulator
MNLSRLMILGLLTERGPMHGHQIRRAGELANAEVWGGITGGALYAGLRKLSGEASLLPRRGDTRIPSAEHRPSEAAISAVLLD